jgi:hypothetical protein
MAEVCAERQHSIPTGAPQLSFATGKNWADTAWVELTPETSEAWVLAAVVLNLQTNVGPDLELDVGIGAAGAESVVATVRTKRATQSANYFGRSYLLFTPPADVVPAGARVALRARNGGLYDGYNVYVAVLYLKKPFNAATGLSTTSQVHRAAPAAAACPTAAMSATPWTWSSWVEVLAETSAAIVITSVLYKFASERGFAELEIGVGAAGAEVPVTRLGTPTVMATGGQYVIQPPVPLAGIEAASRVAFRARKSGTSTAATACAITYYEQPS